MFTVLRVKLNEFYEKNKYKVIIGVLVLAVVLNIRKYAKKYEYEFNTYNY